MHTTRISVILCTYNRSQKLARALDSIARSQVAASVQWEVLVVDNNSKDDTRSVADIYCRRDSKHFRYTFEAQQGKSFALNRGVQECSGDILAFVDDDIVVEPDWLSELTKPLAEPRWIGTGGRVHLPDGFTPPQWMATEGNASLISILAEFDQGTSPHELTIPPIGNNMAFRKEAFERFGSFRTDLGPTPGSQIRHEDTEFGTRVMKGGGRILYVPSAIVRHDVEEERLRKEYFLAYHFDYGRALVRERGKRKPIGIVSRRVISLANRLFDILPGRTITWLREKNEQKRFFNKCRVWTTLGEIKELLRPPAEAPLLDHSELHRAKAELTRQ
jgi:glycosyltransferase involved in cell wall biosynthesis